jgi:hypothetical protein
MSVSLTGDAYVRAITARAGDRRTRAAFQELVLEITPPGAGIYDFGAGPGLDAWLYAECGFHVGAFDVDEQMCASLALRCRGHLEQGRMVLDRGSYEQFLGSRELNAGRSAALITANFAPLCLIADLRPLFAKFHELTTADGQVLASVLSPGFIGDLRHGWWWRHAWQLWRTGSFAVVGAQAPIIRRRLHEFAKQSAPHFTLEQVYAPLGALRVTREVGSSSRTGGPRLRGGGLRSVLQAVSSRFLFLRFRKVPHAGSLVAAARADGASGTIVPCTRPASSRTI